jgi:hypothetical protein
MANVNSIEYVSYQIEIKREMELLHKKLLENNYSQALEHSLNVLVEAKLLTNSIKTWIKEDTND